MEYGSVIFDMDGVILDYAGENFEWQNKAVKKVLNRHGVNTEALDRSDFLKFLGAEGVPGCTEICKEHGLDAATMWEEIGEETTKARARKMKQGELKLFPEVKEVLEQLHQEDVLIGLISNAPEMAIMQAMEYYDLKKYFKFYRGIEDFEDLSDRKPHPDHLNFARAELKRDPFLYVGDHETDIQAAKNAEMDSAWVNRENRSISTEPEYEIGDLKQIVSRIQ